MYCFKKISFDNKICELSICVLSLGRSGVSFLMHKYMYVSWSAYIHDNTQMFVQYFIKHPHKSINYLCLLLSRANNIYINLLLEIFNFFSLLIDTFIWMS